MNKTSPYTLFLILILLTLGMDPESDTKLGAVKEFAERMSVSLSKIKNGALSLQSEVEDMHVMLLGKSKP